jgi:hypothetical protein
MYMDAKKLMNQKNYIMKHNKITEMEIEEIRREMKTSQRSHPAEREEEILVHTDTIKDDENKLNTVTTTREEMETQQHRKQITKLREKIESAYYQVTQIEISKRLRLRKLKGKYKINKTVKTATTTIGKALKDKDLILTEINHLIYAAAVVITEEVNGTGCYKSETNRLKTPLWVRLI